MDGMYFCNPGEIVVLASAPNSTHTHNRSHTNNNTTPVSEGALGRVLGVRKGRVEVELLLSPSLSTSRSSSAHTRVLVSPAELIDAAEDCTEDDNDDNNDNDNGDDDNEDDNDSDEMDEEAMDRLIDQITANIQREKALSAENTPCAPLNVEEIVWNSHNAVWRELLTLAHTQAHTHTQAQAQAHTQTHTQSPQALQIFHEALLAVSNTQERMATLLLSAEEAVRVSAVDIARQCFAEYLSLNPRDTHTQLRFVRFLIDAGCTAESQSMLEGLLQRFPRSASVWALVAATHAHRGESALALAALKKCCFDCALQTALESSSLSQALQTYVYVSRLARGFQRDAPWLSVRACVRALNVARLQGLDPSNTRATRSSSQARSASSCEAVAAALFELAEVLMGLGQQFTSAGRPHACFSSAYAAVDLCTQWAPANAGYQKAKEECKLLCGR